MSGSPATPAVQRAAGASAAVAPHLRPAHATLTLSLTTSATSSGERAVTPLEGVLTLFPGGNGIVSLRGGLPAAVSWFADARQIRLGPGKVDVGATSLRWETGTLRLTDANRDGTLDTGTGALEGALIERVNGDTVASARGRLAIVARPDTSPPHVDVLAVDRDWPDAPILPVAVPELLVSEPIRLETALARLRVRAGAAPVAGRIAPLSPVHGFASSFSFTPDQPLPLGTVLSAQVEGLGDPGGNRAVAGLTATVLPDAGSVLTNASFEHEGTGWVGVGKVTFGGAHAGIGPARGARQAVLDDAARLVGYLDVPATATTLRLSVAAIKKRKGAPEVQGDVVVFAGTQRLPLFSLRHDTERQAPHVVTLDVTALRGTRVFVVARTSAASFWRSAATLLLDDLSIR